MIFDLQAHFMIKSAQANSGCGTARVPMNIGETLLHGSEKSGLQFAGKSSEVLGDFQFDCDLATLRETIDVPAQRRNQTGFVEQRWMEQVGYGAHFLVHVLNEGSTISDGLGR